MRTSLRDRARVWRAQRGPGKAVALVATAMGPWPWTMKRWLESIVAIALAGCSGGDGATSDALSTTLPPSNAPIDGLSSDDLASFAAGEKAFFQTWSETDGLGPLYVATSCGACHKDGARGPGSVQKMVMVEADGFTTAMDQTALPYGNTERRGLAAGATTPIVPPAVPNVLVTTRLGPQMLGRGYMEAIDDAELERVETSQAARADAIHGKINRITIDSVPNPDTTFSHYHAGQANVVGRFGLKAREAVIDDEAASAALGVIGLTSPMQPNEYANPDGLSDDRKPGQDLDISVIDSLAFYIRRVAIPPRIALSDHGAMLFEQVQCSACHVPSLKTRADYPITQLAGIDAPVFTDLLLHDMGQALADGLTDQSATTTTWRTPALIGVKFAGTYLHDGRANTVHDAILKHAGEAAAVVAGFAALSADDQQALETYVEAL